MFISIIRITVQKEKCMEFLQTVTTLLHTFREETNCLKYNIFKEIGQNTFYDLVGEWKSEEDIDNHLNSASFSVLQGAIQNLCEPPRMNLMITSLLDENDIRLSFNIASSF